MCTYVFSVSVVLRFIGRRGTKYHIFYELLMRISQCVLLVYCSRTLLSKFRVYRVYNYAYISQPLVPMLQLSCVHSYNYHVYIVTYMHVHAVHI